MSILFIVSSLINYNLIVRARINHKIFEKKYTMTYTLQLSERELQTILSAAWN